MRSKNNAVSSSAEPRASISSSQDIVLAANNQMQPQVNRATSTPSSVASLTDTLPNLEATFLDYEVYVLTLLYKDGSIHSISLSHAQ